MNGLTKYEKWNPFKEMEDLQNRLSSLFGRSFGRMPLRGDMDDETLTVSEWSPLVDITEDENEYLITAELPEVRKEDVHVTVESGVLTITGERKFEKEQKGRKYHRIERAYGSFSRSFTLPSDADAGKVEAKFKDGVLKVRVTKSETAKPKSIDVKVD